MEGQFEEAAEFLKSIVGTLSSDNLLYFYARYKQAKFGPCDLPKPGFFDFQGKQKWNAWNDLGNKSKEDAMQEYVDKLDEIYPGWAEEELKPQGSWVAVSSMAKESDDLADEHKNICDWIKEGNAKQVQAKLTAQDVTGYRDEEGLGLIHWAADRGDLDIVKLIAAQPSFQVNLCDDEGQTALHYACSNGHYDVVKFLLSLSDIDTSIKDNDGIMAKENIDENCGKMRDLFC